MAEKVLPAPMLLVTPMDPAIADTSCLVRLNPNPVPSTDDPVADTLRFHELIESNVRDHPEQYLWTYKRFKRPGPDGDPYRR